MRIRVFPPYATACGISLHPEIPKASLYFVVLMKSIDTFYLFDSSNNFHRFAIVFDQKISAKHWVFIDERNLL